MLRVMYLQQMSLGKVPLYLYGAAMHDLIEVPTLRAGSPKKFELHGECFKVGSTEHFQSLPDKTCWTYYLGPFLSDVYEVFILCQNHLSYLIQKTLRLFYIYQYFFFLKSHIYLKSSRHAQDQQPGIFAGGWCLWRTL